MAGGRGRGALGPGGLAGALVRLAFLVVTGFSVGLVFGLVTGEPELLARHLKGESEAVALGRLGDAGSGRAVAEDPARTAREASLERMRTTEDGRSPSVVAASAWRSDSSETQEGPLPPVASRPTPARGRDVASGDSRGVGRASAVDSPEGTASAAASPEGAARPARREGGARSALPAAREGRASTRSEAPVAAVDSRRPWAIQVGAFSERAAARRLASALRVGHPVEVLPARREGGRWRVRIQPIATEGQARSLAEQLKREEKLPTWVTPMEGRAGG